MRIQPSLRSWPSMLLLRITASGLTILAICLTGCAQDEGEFVRRLNVRSAAADETISAYLEKSPTLTTEQQKALREKTILVGMPLRAVEVVCAGNLDKFSGSAWRLTNQYVPFRPGLYPYFDWRQAYLYWENDVLAAIIVRGSHNVYP